MNDGSAWCIAGSRVEYKIDLVKKEKKNSENHFKAKQRRGGGENHSRHCAEQSRASRFVLLVSLKQQV